MQICNCTVAIGGEVGMTVLKERVTVPELAILRVIHGEDAVRNIEVIADEAIDSGEERSRLNAVYRSPENIVRDTFGAADRFPGETVLDDWPDAALAALAPDSRTAIVTLTHDPKLDDPAIRLAIRSPAFYLGCLGSKKTHAKRVERLQAAGFSVEEISRIHAPVGLDIGAKTPAEIALSIMGQITATLRLGA